MLYLGPAPLPGEVMQGIAYYYHFGNIKYVHFIHRVFLALTANTAFSTWNGFLPFSRVLHESWQDIFNFQTVTNLENVNQEKTQSLHAISAVTLNLYLKPKAINS